ncbi:MAG: hypothetical protein JWR05_3514 [Mucilaginibacter sp.]|nr:hypothetical protein [Mucilaginibacter sp.]
MGQDLQRANQSLGVSNAVLEIGMEVFHINQLIPYPLTDQQITDWAKSINELRPDVTAATLKAVINKMKLGKIQWDNRSGIQNIFKALENESDQEKDFLSRL